ncbi:Ig-like domain-containing protein [Paenibacillus sp. FSL H3-0457]|uniref:Ig-like domain-containing protein n=1 Tax=Paenibacillus sp. FSL H3-0457 TaxID=2921430 RepID=UPI0030EB835A
MNNNGFRKFISIALTVCLIFGLSGLTPLDGSVANAAIAPTMAETNYDQYQVKLTADPVTDAPPSGFGTAASDGRIWTDKSVTAEGDGSFNVKLSALAQEYMTANLTNPGVGGSGNADGPAADVTFILDMSSSMGNLNGREIAETAGGPGVYYRVEAMAKAANDAIRTVMDANPNNRVAVYWFGGSASSNHLGTFMELGHYVFSSGHGTEDYLKYATSNQNITLNSNLVKDGTAVGTKSAVSLGAGTPTQDGIMYGVSKTMSSVGTKGTGPKRQPYLFLLSDGAAIHAKKAWYTSPKGKSFETDFQNAVTEATTIANYNQSGTDGTKYVPATAGTSLANTGDPEIAALTILTGAYMKGLLDNQYTAYNGGESTKAKVYTVGLGSTTAINGPYSGSQPVYAWAGLDPKRVNDHKEDSSYNYGTAKNTYDKLKTYAAQGPNGFNYADSFVYSNYYTFAPTYDIVSSAFAGLANDVEATTTILPLLNIPETTDLGSETADIASAIVVADEISEDFNVDLSTLKIGDAVATVDATTTINGGTAYQFAGYGSKAVIKTVAGVTSLTWYIDAEDMQRHIYRFKNRTSPKSGEYSAPTDGSFALNYKVKPTFQMSPNNVGNISRYLNSGNAMDGAKTAAYFFPPTDSPYYLALTSKQTISKSDGIGATYVTEESMNNGRATMKLGNNGKLDLKMGIDKTGPATIQTNGSINYTVTIYNYTNTTKTGLSVTSEGQTQTGIDVPANSSKVLSFTKTAPGTPQTVISDNAVISSINLGSNTVTTNVTDVTTAVVTTHVIEAIGGTTEGDNTYNIGDSATIKASADQGYAFVGWYDNQAGTGTPVSTSAAYTFTVQADVGYYAKYVMLPVAENDTYSVLRGDTLTVSSLEGILMNDTDAEGRPLTAGAISSVSDPSKGTLNVSPDGSFTFVADEEASGNVTFTYQADNGIAQSNVATVTIAITLPVSTHEPIAENDTYRIKSGDTLTVPVEAGILTNDTDDENHPLTAMNVSSISDPSMGTLNVSPDGSFTFIAEENASGNVTFTYQAFDGTVYSSVATVTITITLPINTHVIGNVGGTTNGDDSYGLGESATIAANPSLGYSFVGWYENEEGTGISVSSDASYTFTVQTAGDYYAKFRAVPVAENDSYQVARGGKLTVPVEKGILLNDTSAGNDTLTAVNISSISDASKGTLTANSDGSFTFEAKEEASGSVTFTYQASDGTGQSNIATVTISITNPSIVGTVMDKKTGDPVSGATVILRDLAGKEKERFTTGSNGKYNFENVVINKYILEVVSDEYSFAHREISVSTVNVNTNGVVIQDFELVEFEMTLTANPSSILGNGASTSVFKAVVTDKEGHPQAGVQVVFKVPDTTYGHFAGNLNTISVLTDAHGIATTTFTGAILGGTESASIPLTATVADSPRDLYVSDTIHITITPGVITGIVTDQAGHPVAGALIKVSKDFDGDGITDFHAVAVTVGDGAYTLAIPKGNVTYDVSITKQVEIGGQKKSVTFNQSVPVNASVDGRSFEGNKTVSGVVLVETSQGGSLALNGTVGGGYTVLINDGNGAHTGQIDSNGIFNIDSVLKGIYTADVIYNIPLPGGGTQPVVVGHADIEISSDGQISISEVLIDPYGTITDSVTGHPISGAIVTLHYSNGTVVNLPPVSNFPPADNANPQTSDVTGQYAFMVFPHTDYYLTATKAGYKDFDSRVVDTNQPLIHVGTEIVLYDFSMTPLPSSNGGGSPVVTTDPVGPPVTTTEPAPPKTITTKPIDFATAILVDKMKGREDDILTFTVIYANKTLTEADGLYVKATIPAGMSLVDANGGVVTGQEIKWNVGKLAGDTRGQLTFKLKVNEMTEGENYASVTALIGSDHKLTLVNTQDDTSLIKVMLYSNRYEHKHDRYIMGYPDGNVKPEKLITRAEIAAIFARTLHLQDEVRHIKLYSDVATDYWGADYIEAVANKGIFKGYADHTFRPDQPITRAELATAIARYLGVAKELKMDPILRISSFTDIEGNWAEQSIDEVFRFGIVSGYKDASFQPGSQITREEAVKMINGMLYRGPLTGAEPSYPDNRLNKWSYGHVEEATRTHTYKINEDGSETMIKYIPEDLW